MLTPFFTINQDEEFIFIDVKISHMRFSAQNLEMIVDNELFIFSLSPYYLRLRLPYACVDDERSHAEFDSKTDCVKIKIPKEIKGQNFPDLDLTAKLLARSTTEADEPLMTAIGEDAQTKDTEKPQGPAKPLIQELDVDNDISKLDTLKKDIEEGEKFNWEVSQTVPQKENELEIGNDASLEKVKYGFNNQYDEIVGLSMANGNDINELGDPESTALTDRIIERLIKENIKFDPEYYAADYIMEKYPTEDDDKNLKGLLEWKSPTTKNFMKWYKSQQEIPAEQRQNIMPVEFTKDEQEKMLNLPRKSYILEDNYKPQLLMLIVSLLFSYQFDFRENEGDHNIESAWTIGKLTPQICFLDSQISIPNEANNESALKATIITCIRRALSYPLHRNHSLIKKVLDDVYYNLRGGKRLILKSLLDLKELFRFHDVYYVYDKIWLEDLSSWIISDQLSEGTIRNLSHDFKKEYTSLNKSDITFEKLDQDEDTQMQTEDDEDEDNMIALNLEEIEQMAESSYQQYMMQ